MSVITVLHLGICILLILIVLLQQGKGADAGATFGGGGQTVFGAGGADTLLTKVTTVIALCFMCTSVTLAISSNKSFIAEGELFSEEVPSTAPVANPATSTEEIPSSDTSSTKDENSDNTAALKVREQQPVAAVANADVTATDEFATNSAITPSEQNSETANTN